MKKYPIEIPGVLLVVAGLVIFFGIILSEIFFKGYSTRDNVVSDLGRQAAPVNSPMSSVLTFNIAMIASGVAVALAGFLLIPIISNKWITIPLIVHGVAIACVGLFPSNLGVPHGIAAITTFLTVEFAAVIAFSYFSSPMRYISVALGLIGFVSLVLNPIIKNHLGDGGAERLIIYPTTFWLICLGVYLMSIKGSK